MSIDVAAFRSLVARAQGLGREEDGEPFQVVVRHGLVRALGGVDPYLALKARAPELTRADIDRAVLAGEIRIVPAVRGCIYLAAREQVAWSLRLADLLSRRRVEREHEKVGVEPKEIARLGDLVDEVLERDGPSTTTALRRSLPDGAIRSLGDAGKKLGISSTLPPTLRRLELDGRIERRLDNGRLDTERYLWALTAGDQPELAEVPDEEPDLFRRFAGWFFRWAGVGTADRFASWAGLGKRVARSAAEGLELEPVEVDEIGLSGAVLGSATRSAAEASGRAVLLPFEDNLMQLQGGPRNLVDERHHGVVVPVWGRGKGTTLGDVAHVMLRTIAIDGEIVGFWELDRARAEVATHLFADVGAAGRTAVAAEASSVADFLLHDFGHGRSFSLDTDEAVQRRADQIRSM